MAADIEHEAAFVRAFVIARYNLLIRTFRNFTVPAPY